MKVQILNKPEAAEKLIAASAKLCYTDTDVAHIYEDLTADSTAKFLDMLTSVGHESPLEHATFTFGIEGVSRATLAHITRHRIASFSVQSQRYIKVNNFDYVTPPAIKENTQADVLYVEAMNHAIQKYKEIVDILETQYIQEYMEQGLSEQKAKNKAEKRAIEDARFVLPNASKVNLVVTMNIRSLMNFFRLRCCNRAQWEIRELAWEMLRLVKEEAPTVFKNAGPACIGGKCGEGSMCCGKPYK